MRLYNVSSKTSSANYILMLEFFLIFAIMDFVFFGFILNWHLTFENFFICFSVVIKFILGSDNELRLCYILLFIMPTVFFVLFVYQYIARKVKLNELNKNLYLKYIDFENDNMSFKFNCTENDFECGYEKFNSCEMIICTCRADYGSFSPYVVSELIIELELLNQDKIKLNSIPNDIYEVIKYLAKAKTFRYKIIGPGDYFKEKLAMDIDLFLFNGFKKPNIHQQLIPFYIVLAIIFLFLILFDFYH